MNTCPSFPGVSFSLKMTSAHAISVLNSWPLSVSNHIHALSVCSSCSLPGGPSPQSKLIQRYTHANAHPALISILEQWQPKLHSNVVCAEQLRPLICPIRYHPVTRRCFHIARSLVPTPPELNLRVLGAWRNALPSVAGVVQSLNMTVVKGS